MGVPTKRFEIKAGEKMLPWTLCGILSIIIAMLLVKIRLLQKSMDEIREAFKERLSIDTNTLIAISAGDTHAKRLASDINTQLRLLRQQRRQYLNGDRELKEAVTHISHDLRTPITAISGYLDLLEREDKNEAVTRYLAYIANRTEALKQLTEELFRYSVILSVKDAIPLEAVNVNAVLEESLAAFYPVLAERHITPAIQMPEQNVICSLNKSAVSRVFGNILSNAVKYSDGDLAISLSKDGELIFSNRAAGLNQVQVAKLFNRFYTVENARNATGLGLSIAKMTVEQMNGKISAQYDSGQLRIHIRFPLASAVIGAYA